MHCLYIPTPSPRYSFTMHVEFNNFIFSHDNLILSCWWWRQTDRPFAVWREFVSVWFSDFNIHVHVHFLRYSFIEFRGVKSISNKMNLNTQIHSHYCAVSLYVQFFAFKLENIFYFLSKIVNLYILPFDKRAMSSHSYTNEPFIFFMFLYFPF